jgi:hypothetical protein
MNRKQFYWSASVIFRQLFGRSAPWSALHEACKRWERSRGFSKRDMQNHLFDNLKAKKRVPHSYSEHVHDYLAHVYDYCEHVYDYNTYLMMQKTRPEGHRRYAYLQYREAGGTLPYMDWLSAQSPPPSSASD